MNVVAEIQRINERELELGVGFEGSWHQKYKESAWVYIGGLAFELSEGDVLCVMSQFGEIEDLNLVRDGKTGKSKGFAFVKYENWLSGVLAVDNLNGARLLERTIRVDHVLQYKLPKEVQDRENEKAARLLGTSESENNSDSASDPEEKDKRKEKKARKKEKGDAVPSQRGLPGHAYEGKELATGFDIAQGQNVFDAPEETKDEKKKRKKKEKKEKKKRKERKSVEEKQAEWMEQVRLKRQAQREQEERERARAAAAGDGEFDAAVPQASETGWRGRLEPTARAAVPPSHATGKRRSQGGDKGGDKGDAAAYGERERKRQAGFGGINRTR